MGSPLAQFKVTAIVNPPRSNAEIGPGKSSTETTFRVVPLSHGNPAEWREDLDVVELNQAIRLQDNGPVTVEAPPMDLSTPDGRKRIVRIALERFDTRAWKAL